MIYLNYRTERLSIDNVNV